jgi:hypothetical protein
LSVGIREKGEKDEYKLRKMFGGLWRSNREEIDERGIRRIKFDVIVRRKFKKLLK